VVGRDYLHVESVSQPDRQSTVSLQVIVYNVVAAIAEQFPEKPHEYKVRDAEPALEHSAAYGLSLNGQFALIRPFATDMHLAVSSWYLAKHGHQPGFHSPSSQPCYQVEYTHSAMHL
jgi:hypothetical protein